MITRRRPTANHSPQVAVVVPLPHSKPLSSDEDISVRHLCHYLHNFDKYAIAPQGLKASVPGCETLWLDAKYFGSAAAHSQLLVSRYFYAIFEDYDYILIYHLDALVLSDRLADWCELNYDYIGAPWLRNEERPELGFAGVGNGGFSLRRVKSFLAVLDSRVYAVDPERDWRLLIKHPRSFLRRRLPWRNNVRRELARSSKNDDLFWGYRAQHFYPRFRVAPVDVALAFAFEMAPRFCFTSNGGCLPFGCHAWTRYDRSFWEPYLLPSPSPGDPPR